MSRALLLLLTIGLFFGCGGRDSAPPGETVTRDIRDPSPAPAAAGERNRYRTLSPTMDTPLLEVWVVAPLPTGANPWRDRNVLETLLFPRTLRRDPETLQWEPWLAESWRIDEDRRFAEVTLQEGFTWSDGRPITSTDWVTPANRYFTDPGARSALTGATMYAGLDPRWTTLGERSFRVEVAEPTDRATLLSLLSLPPLPEEVASIDELNSLWRFPASPGAPGVAEGYETVVSGGPYSVESVVREEESLLVRLTRRKEYVDPAYGGAGAREVRVRFVTQEWYLAAVEDDPPPEAHLIYFGPESEQRTSDVPSGYRTLSAGSDLTPTVLILGRESVEPEGLRAAARAGRDLFLADSVGEPVFGRRYPSWGVAPRGTEGAAGTAAAGVGKPLGPPLFGLGDRDGGGGSAADGGDPSPASPGPETEVAPEGDETSNEGVDVETDRSVVTVLVQEGEEERRYAEFLLAAARERGIPAESRYLDRESLAAELLNPDGWAAAVVEFRELPEPTLGDPLFGNLLPLTHRWELIVSRRLPRTIASPHLTPAELADLESVAAGPGGWEQLLTRLWKTLVVSEREAERRLAQGALEELWSQREPWVYLFDEERLHFFRPGLGNLLFRHIPGADLGTVLPLLYFEKEEG